MAADLERGAKPGRPPYLWFAQTGTRVVSGPSERCLRLGRVSQFGGAHAGVDDCTGQQDAAEVGQGVLVVAGRDAAPLFEPVEAALDGVAQPVECGVERGRATAG